MDWTSQVVPTVEQCFLLIGNSQEVPFENSLRRDGQFNWLFLFEILINDQHIIIENSKISIAAPNEISSATAYHSLERCCFDYSEFLTITQTEIMAVRTVLQIRRINFSRTQLFGRKRHLLPICKRSVVYGLQISSIDFHRLCEN